MNEIDRDQGDHEPLATATATVVGLAEIFARMNMGELPAMSTQVQKLIFMAKSQHTDTADLAKLILQDYSLTNKVLQVVNSAYYSLPSPCSAISQAVNILGFNTIRDLALTIALFDHFVELGVDKETLSKLLARSFLSGTFARRLLEEQKGTHSAEETFICTMFHNLGKIILSIYFPEKYRAIEQRVDEGMRQNDACRQELHCLTYQALGAEVAKFWNLPVKVVACMGKNPKAPTPTGDEQCWLQNMANFANMFVDCVCNGSDLGPVFQKYGGRLAIGCGEAIAVLKKCVDIAENVSEIVSYGFYKLKVRIRLQNLEIKASRGLLASASEEEQQPGKVVFRSCGDEEEAAEAHGEQPTSVGAPPDRHPAMPHPHPPPRQQAAVRDKATKCLLVDDEPILLSLANDCLTGHGYRCTMANSGEAALDLLARQSFDIMITDIVMGGISGIELTKRAKKLDGAMPVIIMTGFTDTYTYDQVIDAGAADFLQKPFSLKELETRVARVLRDSNMLELIKQKGKALEEISNLMIAGLQQEALQKVKSLEEEIGRLKEENYGLKGRGGTHPQK